MKNTNHNTICHAILVLLALLYFHKCGKNIRDITTFILVFLVYWRGSQSGLTMVKLKRTFDARSYFEPCLNHTSGTWHYCWWQNSAFDESQSEDLYPKSVVWLQYIERKTKTFLSRNSSVWLVVSFENLSPIFCVGWPTI